ncbi:MAG: carboxymuconolactone decarboxylase family protein [Hyphomicrobiales bacterium]|nr:carboxymuconolactone decarboxylase family protein [Hyphomicrobiales bacterium]
MPNLPLVTNNEDPRIAKIYNELLAQKRGFPNLYRLIGNSGPMLQAWCDLAWPLRHAATTPRRLRELVILRGAQIMGADYEWTHHLEMAHAAGVPQQKIDALKDGWKSPAFDAKEQAALRLAEEITHGPGASREAMAQARDHFGDDEVVELVLTSSFYACVGRMLHSLDVPLEK